MEKQEIQRIENFISVWGCMTMMILAENLLFRIAFLIAAFIFLIMWTVNRIVDRFLSVHNKG